MQLTDILQNVAKGKLDLEKAHRQIEALYRGTPAAACNSEPRQGAATDTKEGRTSTLERLKRTVHVDELLQVSSSLMGQIAESMPQIEDIKENIAHNLQPIGLSAKTEGIESKFSVFRAFQAGENCVVAANQVAGSQMFSVGFSDTSVFRGNKLTAVQFTEFDATRSDFCDNIMSLVRLSNVTIQESRVDANRLTRTTFSDLSLAESDFTENELSKSEFSQTIVNASRLAKNTFAAVDFKDCEFNSCNLAGFEFENCQFSECVFSDLTLECPQGAPFKIANIKATGLSVRNCRTPADFLAALEGKPVSKSRPEPDSSRELRN